MNYRKCPACGAWHKSDKPQGGVGRFPANGVDAKARSSGRPNRQGSVNESGGGEK